MKETTTIHQRVIGNIIMACVYIFVGSIFAFIPDYNKTTLIFNLSISAFSFLLCLYFAFKLRNEHQKYGVTFAYIIFSTWGILNFTPLLTAISFTWAFWISVIGILFVSLFPYIYSEYIEKNKPALEVSPRNRVMLVNLVIMLFIGVGNLFITVSNHGLYTVTTTLFFYLLSLVLFCTAPSILFSDKRLSQITDYKSDIGDFMKKHQL
ncbi:hypothetical protein SAMN04487944_12618 [Gracilibacillus ureilyticus]|uniref:Uncharacterized protein n=1 Tax=Gracilibacillus ureilyticus TaxID=531814 RepID=A0A1H9VQT3_9BACI|nr:hypothetical protein [Gracilibacillus ureilyticus]SES23834.1 hypothetical protein SAMN04487944_12618 [Gracilibacillus ureilyticus]